MTICHTCAHEQRNEIDRQLIEGIPASVIARAFGLHERGVRRHAADHLPAAMVKAQDAREVASADGLLEQVRSLQEKTLAILRTAEKKNELRTALTAIREARANTELLAKLLGELPEAQINIILSPEWAHLRAVILTAVSPYPEARMAIVAAIEASNVSR